MITVVMTNYRRPANVPLIITSLLQQSIRPIIFVWDNSPEQTFRDTRADWVIRSSRNAVCSARWWMARQAESPFVAILDDDLALNDASILEDSIAACEKYSQAVGAAGVKLRPGSKYRECLHVENPGKDTLVDIIKGRFFATASDRLRGLPCIGLDDEDDIFASAYLNGGVVPARLLSRFHQFPNGPESLVKRSDHWTRRERARRIAFMK